MSTINQWPDLDEWAPIPGQVGYLLHRDGRVMSLRTPGGPKILAENPGRRLTWRTVRIGNMSFRVRDLVGIVWGDLSDLDARTEYEYEVQRHE